MQSNREMDLAIFTDLLPAGGGGGWSSAGSVKMKKYIWFRKPD